MRISVLISGLPEGAASPHREVELQPRQRIGDVKEAIEELRRPDIAARLVFRGQPLQDCVLVEEVEGLDEGAVVHAFVYPGDWQDEAAREAAEQQRGDDIWQGVWLVSLGIIIWFCWTIKMRQPLHFDSFSTISLYFLSATWSYFLITFVATLGKRALAS